MTTVSTIKVFKAIAIQNVEQPCIPRRAKRKARGYAKTVLASVAKPNPQPSSSNRRAQLQFKIITNDEKR